MIGCVNFMDPEGIRKTVEEHQRLWGNPDDAYDLSEDNLAQQCSMCDFGISKVSRLVEAVGVATGDICAQVQLNVKRLSGKPLKRVCFKEENHGSNRSS